MKWVYRLLFVVGAIAAVWIGILGMNGVMSAAVVLALASLFAAESDRIAEISATATGGFSAKTRALIDEARATIDQLRAVGKIAVQANLLLVMRAGRWGGFTHDEKDKVRQVSIAALDQLGVSQSEQEAMFDDWHRVVRFDYSHFLLGKTTVPKHVLADNKLHSEWSALREGGFENTPSADTLQRFLEKAGLLDDDAKQLLADYRYYETHQKHRRPEVWKALVDAQR